MKKSRFSPNGPKTQKILRCKALYIGHYEYVNISSFAVLGIKLSLEEDGNLNRNDSLSGDLIKPACQKLAEYGEIT